MTSLYCNKCGDTDGLPCTLPGCEFQPGFDPVGEAIAEDAALRAGKAPFISNTREFMAAKKAKPDIAARCEALQQLLNDRDQKLDDLETQTGKLRADIDNLEAEKFALEDQVKGLQELGAAVPPAGDVEAVVLVVRHGPMDSDGCPIFVRAETLPDAPYDIENLPDGFELVDRAHVTRLTAERDGLLALYEDTQARLIDSMKDAKALETELTKARELLEPLAAYAADSANAVMRARAVSARKLLAHQAAPAAKAGE